MKLRLTDYEKKLIAETARTHDISYRGIIDYLADRHTDSLAKDLKKITKDDEIIETIRFRSGNCEDWITV